MSYQWDDSSSVCYRTFLTLNLHLVIMSEQRENSE